MSQQCWLETRQQQAMRGPTHRNDGAATCLCPHCSNHQSKLEANQTLHLFILPSCSNLGQKLKAEISAVAHKFDLDQTSSLKQQLDEPGVGHETSAGNVTTS